MKIDKVLGVDVSFEIKKRLEDVYGITGHVDVVLDCVADAIEDERIIEDLKESYEDQLADKDTEIMQAHQDYDDLLASIREDVYEDE